MDPKMEVLSTGDTRHRMEAIRAELDSLAEEARQSPPGPDAREALQSLMARMLALIREVEEAKGPEIPAEVREMMAEIQQMLDNWDELEPMWAAFRALQAALALQPRTRESVELVLQQARALRATLDSLRTLLPASYYETMTQSYDPMIAALAAALSERGPEE